MCFSVSFLVKTAPGYVLLRVCHGQCHCPKHDVTRSRSYFFLHWYYIEPNLDFEKLIFHGHSQRCDDCAPPDTWRNSERYVVCRPPMLCSVLVLTVLYEHTCTACWYQLFCMSTRVMLCACILHDRTLRDTVSRYSQGGVSFELHEILRHLETATKVSNSSFKYREHMQI